MLFSCSKEEEEEYAMRKTRLGRCIVFLQQFSRHGLNLLYIVVKYEKKNKEREIKERHMWMEQEKHFGISLLCFFH